MDPQSIGWPSSSLVLGKLSGRAGLRSRLEEMGYKLTDSELNQAFKAFKDLADRKREITNADLESLMSSQRRTSDVPNLYTLSSVKVTSGNDSTPTATVNIDNPEGSSIIESSVGTGPVDAVYKAIDKVVQVDNELLEYRVEAVTEGIDAIGDVSIRISKDNTIYVGRGSDTDIIVASAKAYMNAINRVLAFN
jgi:2-isopropylmalate synthase